MVWRAYPGRLHGPDSNGQLPSTTDSWPGEAKPCAEAAAKADGPPTPASVCDCARARPPDASPIGVSLSGPLRDSPGPRLLAYLCLRMSSAAFMRPDTAMDSAWYRGL